MMHRAANEPPPVDTDPHGRSGGGGGAAVHDVCLPGPGEAVMRVLLVEEDPRLYRALEQSLQRETMEIVHVIEAAAALDRAGGADLDVIVFDLGPHDGHGMAALADLRRMHPQVPALIVTSGEAVEARVEALVGAADDFLVEPFVGEELVARIRALRRRAAESRLSSPVIEDTIVLDDSDVSWFTEQPAPLTPRGDAIGSA